MKMGNEHLVPISKQIRQVLDELIAVNDSKWLLPGPYTNKPVPENTLITTCYRMGYNARLTVHELWPLRIKSCKSDKIELSSV